MRFKYIVLLHKPICKELKLIAFGSLEKASKKMIAIGESDAKKIE